VALARVGYRFDEAWRVEIEGGTRPANMGKISGGGSAPNGVCNEPLYSYSQVLPFDCEGSNGRFNVWSVMTNGMRDFGGKDAWVRPFVGGGVGFARASVGFGGKLKGIGGPETAPWGWDSTRGFREQIGGDSVGYSLAYQLMAGAAVRLDDRTSVEVTYRHFVAPDLKWKSFNSSELTPALGKFAADYIDSTFTLGVRYAFGVSR
jgi:opacity protein-like surface antigen